MLASAAQTNTLNLTQLIANFGTVLLVAGGLYKALDRAFNKKIDERVHPKLDDVTDALKSHMVEEENQTKSLVKVQKKLAKTIDAHMESDAALFSAVQSQLSRIERQGVEAAADRSS